MNLFTKTKNSLLGKLKKFPIVNEWYTAVLVFATTGTTVWFIVSEAYSPTLLRLMILANSILVTTYLIDRVMGKIQHLMSTTSMEILDLKSKVADIDDGMREFLRMQAVNEEVQSDLSDRLDQDAKDTAGIRKIIDRRDFGVGQKGEAGEQGETGQDGQSIRGVRGMTGEVGGRGLTGGRGERGEKG